MTITTIGIDLAKEVFQIHGANEQGNVWIRKQRFLSWNGRADSPQSESRVALSRRG